MCFVWLLIAAFGLLAGCVLVHVHPGWDALHFLDFSSSRGADKNDPAHANVYLGRRMAESNRNPR